MSSDATKRIELVSDREIEHRTSYIGLGLLASLIVGWGPLTDALFGYGSFEGALGRFVACVAVCVAGASSLGRLLDSAPRSETDAETEAETEGPTSMSSEGVESSPAGAVDPD
jgi:hypothetical protein